MRLFNKIVRLLNKFLKAEKFKIKATPDRYETPNNMRHGQELMEEYLEGKNKGYSEDILKSILKDAADCGNGRALDILYNDYGLVYKPVIETNPQIIFENEARDRNLLKPNTDKISESLKKTSFCSHYEDEWSNYFDIYSNWVTSPPENKDENDLERAIDFFERNIEYVERNHMDFTDNILYALQILVDYYTNRDIDKAFIYTKLGAENKNPTLSYFYALVLKRMGKINEAIQFMKEAQHGESTALLAKVQLALMYMLPDTFKVHQDDAINTIESGIAIIENQKVTNKDSLLLYILKGDYYIKLSEYRNDVASLKNDQENALEAYKLAYYLIEKKDDIMAMTVANKLYHLYMKLGNEKRAKFYHKKMGDTSFYINSSESSSRPNTLSIDLGYERYIEKPC